MLLKRTIVQIRLLNKYCQMKIKNKMFVIKNLEACEFRNIGNSNIINSICDCPLINIQRGRLKLTSLYPNL